MIEIKNVSKQYNGEFALNKVSLKIDKGLHFIVGTSGSGKTTLLKIISAMDQEFEGDVLCYDKSIKTLSKKQKGFFYNNIFGFVWQDFHLLEESTVLENVLLPQYLKNNQNIKNAESILKNLKILELAKQKVKNLSGGQKQRVAIARELMKNPQIIIADEPTSALDEEASKTIMAILRMIAKKRTVIVVTHDTSLITENDKVIELEKGEVVSKPDVVLSKVVKIKTGNTGRFSIHNAFQLAKTNFKNKFGRFIIGVLTLIIASVLLLTTVSGAITSTGQSEFNKLIETYGEALCDISIINSFMDASGTQNEDKNKPSGDVDQDINGLYDLFVNDERISFVTYLQAFDDIGIWLDDKEYKVQSSGNTPVINKLIAGKMPMNNKNEVVVPESFVKSLGMSIDNVIGKEIDFNGSIYNWSTGQPVLKKTSITAKIVGVIDTTAKYEHEGKVQEYTIDDAFFFSKTALESMCKQAETNINNQNFLMRAKSPADMIELKDELSSKGIVPLGQFELVEDMVRLNSQTTQQSGTANIIISVLSCVMVFSIFLITGFMRKKEYAIYKLSGLTTSHLAILNLAEILIYTGTAILLMFVTSPLLTIVTKSLFGVNILNLKILLVGVFMILITGIIAYCSAAISFVRIDLNTVLKTGDK